MEAKVDVVNCNRVGKGRRNILVILYHCEGVDAILDDVLCGELGSKGVWIGDPEKRFGVSIKRNCLL